MSSILTDFLRVSRARRCPICGRADWCLVDRGDPPARAVCQRIESPRPWGEAGWLHVLRSDAAGTLTVRRVRTVASSSGLHVTDFASLAARFAGQVVPTQLDTLGKTLGVTVWALGRLGIGWTGRAWSFPMRDNTGAIIGIRLRLPDSTKLAIRGSREGLFIPRGMDASEPLLVAEGPTDSAALLDLGFSVVGRPSCTGGGRFISSFIRCSPPTNIVVVSDADAPGRRGAIALAASLAPLARAVRVIVPPEPINDVREWVRAGATAHDVHAAIAAAPVHTISIRTRRSFP